MKPPDFQKGRWEEKIASHHPFPTPGPAQEAHWEVKISSISGRGQRLMRKLLYTDSGKSSGLIASFWGKSHLVTLPPPTQS